MIKLSQNRKEHSVWILRIVNVENQSFHIQTMWNAEEKKNQKHKKNLFMFSVLYGV